MLNNLNKIVFNHTPKETLDLPKEQITWKQTFANREGFKGIIALTRWIDNWEENEANAAKTDYYRQVWEHSELNAPMVPNIELRGKDYHLDHIIPISYGFKAEIDPAIIGGLNNLQILSHRDNFLKAAKYKPELAE